MIYEKDGVPFVNPLRVDGVLIYNPTVEQLENAGYKLKGGGYVCPSTVRKYSKLKIVRALGVKFEALKNTLKIAGVYDQFDHATYIASNDPLFKVIADNLTRYERHLLETKCLYDDVVCPLDAIEPYTSGSLQRVTISASSTPTESDERAMTLIFPSVGAYFKSAFDESDTNCITVIPPVLSCNRPYLSWQLEILNTSASVTQFNFNLGNLDVAVTGNTPAGYPTQLFEFYWDGEMTRCSQRSLIEHVVEYQSE